MGGSCQSVSFSHDDKFLYTVGDQADIYQWDLKQRRCVAKLPDEGSFQTTVIDASSDGKYLATGSKMGTVNIFSLDQPLNSKTVPEKTLMNLTTSITDLKFSPTSESLTFCSKWKKDAVRMAHIPSYTAFQNFPGSAVGILKYPLCLDYS